MPNSDELRTSATLLRQLNDTDPDSKEAAWRRFMERYQEMISLWCRRRGLQHDDAEMVTSMVLAKLAAEMGQFEYDPARRFRSWLKTVVRNTVIDFLRSQQRRPWERGRGGSPDKDGPDLEAPAACDDLVQELNEELEKEMRLAERVVAAVRARVKESYRWEAYWRTAIEGESPAAVAQQLGKTITTVYMAKYSVGKMLREEARRLQKGGPEALEDRP
jgi:RNA polymerase sigma factor (sigma-70 family)